MLWLILLICLTVIVIVLIVLDKKLDWDCLSDGPDIFLIGLFLVLNIVTFFTRITSSVFDLNGYKQMKEFSELVDDDDTISIDLYNEYNKKIISLNENIQSEREAMSEKNYNFYHVKKYDERVANLEPIVWKPNVKVE